MIKSFSHKGLKHLFEKDDRGGVSADQVRRIQAILAHLDEAKHPNDLALPGYRLHPLRGDLRGYWSVTVRANWRIIFRFEKDDVFNVDLIDYH